MSPEEMLLDPLRLAAEAEPERIQPQRRIHAAEQPGQGPVVPPVRTIVLDRAPLPAPPPSERASVRTQLAGAGPERLRLEEVSIDYGPKQAVKSVSLSIHQGEVLALIGPSGCGKTTLLRTLNRLTELTPSASRAGRIMLDGEDIHELPDTTLRGRVAMVFQQPNPFPMSIFDNVAFALREQSRKRPRRRELEPQVIEALRRAGLYEEVRDNLDGPALRLSGGQQQRLCIARAIAPRPEVLLMDEPCSALDPISTKTIEKLIGELRRDLAVVVVTHNLAQAHRIADKVAFMYLGDLIEYGSTAQVFDEPRATRTRDYVGGAFG
ncbi:MAG: phosphate transport system ATP-binding protein [Solirubrobacteraceae bacterium]|jgi:phosphate transport system ATP-binding protein|nr:transporter related protein [Solirubrobacterales bacterium]MEA2215643.1 phosphate transport system ATP-binding protein [Solirubrobacteraceae bacterium]